LTIGVLLGRLTETIVFLFSFAVIRSFSGGYHAETYWKCIIYFLITYILNIMVVVLVPYASYFVGLIAVLLIFICAPVENENCPLSKKERCCFKYKSRYSVVTASIIITLGQLILPGQRIIFFSSLLGLLAAAVSTAVGEIKEIKERKEGRK
jgi:accessory gene regulator B